MRHQTVRPRHPALQRGSGIAQPVEQCFGAGHALQVIGPDLDPRLLQHRDDGDAGAVAKIIGIGLEGQPQIAAVLPRACSSPPARR